MRPRYILVINSRKYWRIKGWIHFRCDADRGVATAVLAVRTTMMPRRNLLTLCQRHTARKLLTNAFLIHLAVIISANMHLTLKAAFCKYKMLLIQPLHFVQRKIYKILGSIIHVNLLANCGSGKINLCTNVRKKILKFILIRVF